MVSNNFARCRLSDVPTSVYCERILFNAIDNLKVQDGKAIASEFAIDSLFTKKPKFTELDALIGICNQLGGCRIEERKDDDSEYQLTMMFSKIKLDMNKRIVCVEMNGAIEPYLVSLREQFTKIPLQIFCSLSSVYSQRLYRLLKSHVGHGIVRYGKESLYDLLGAPDCAKKSTKKLNANIIAPAIKEINKKTDLTISFEPHRKGRAITSYKFTIIDKDNLDRRQKLNKEYRAVAAKEKNKPEKQDPQYEAETGLSHETVVKMLKEYRL